MGTAKYPKENEYSEFLAQHSGSSNAFTGLDNTNYYFEVGHDHLEGALDRFAQFFISPAFSENCKDRELRAVDSEHKKNLQSDSWRLFQLEKNLSSPDHPYSQFGTGNLETLQDAPGREGVDVRDELIKFHAKYYSANIMKLVILGRGKHCLSYMNMDIKNRTSWLAYLLYGHYVLRLCRAIGPAGSMGD